MPTAVATATIAIAISVLLLLLSILLWYAVPTTHSVESQAVLNDSQEQMPSCDCAVHDKAALLPETALKSRAST